jgi:hypothetical protein
MDDRLTKEFKSVLGQSRGAHSSYINNNYLAAFKR